MRRTVRISILAAALLLLGTCAVQAQSVNRLDVVVRDQSGAAAVGVIVKLYTMDEARDELRDLRVSAATDASGVAHFAVRPALVAPRLLTGKSGIVLISEEAQSYSQPGLQFLTSGQGPIRIVILTGGVPVPDTTAAPQPPAPPLLPTPQVGVPQSSTWDEELARRGLPTLMPAAAVASATAWAAETGLVDERTRGGTPVSTTPSTSHATATTTTTTVPVSATPTTTSPQAVVTSLNSGGLGMWSCLILLILGFGLSLIYSRRLERRAAMKGANQ